MEITAISTMMEVRNWKLSINMNVSGLRFIMKVSIKDLPTTRSALNKIKKGFGYNFYTLLSPPEANPKIKKNYLSYIEELEVNTDNTSGIELPLEIIQLTIDPLFNF